VEGFVNIKKQLRHCAMADSMFYGCSDLSSVTSLKQVILNSFSPPSEEVKSAASYTLGSVAVGNLPQYLPFVLQEIEAQPKRQYLLLHSLKEVSEMGVCKCKVRP
jgi:cullin-associated NEDD8-dissociated protein 1